MEGIAKTDGRVDSLGVDGAAGVGLRGKGGMRLQNPFTFKVGQVFTGFGIGCGVGIGVGRPINMGAILVVNQVMSATRGATDAFSGVTRHVNDSLRRVGAKNTEAGIGCGVGFGHGFGVGLALKPGVIHQIQSASGDKADDEVWHGAELNSRLKSISYFSPKWHEYDESDLKYDPIRKWHAIGSAVSREYSTVTAPIWEYGTGIRREQCIPGDAPVVSRTEKVLNDFLQNPLLKREDPQLDGLTRIRNRSIVPGAPAFLGDFRITESNGWEAGRLRSENNLLRMVLKLQQVIEELKEQNQKLQHILVEELKVPPSKIRGGSNALGDDFLCKDCFECRRKQRRR